MSEVVFLSNTNIQIAVGSATPGGVKVSKLYSAPLPEGALLNGVVMDKDVLIDAIKTAWQINKLPKSDVTLILNSPQLRANRLDAPIQPDKKTTAFITRETADAKYGRFQHPITGWYVVSKDNKSKTQRVIYETAEREFVFTYIDIFDKAGLKLKSIHSGVQLATEFFTKQSAGKTVIYMILDGTSLVTIFFAEGKYYYDSTTRVFSQPGTPEFVREIYNSISSIRQFISAQHMNETVKDVLFAGLTQPQVTQISNDILNIDSALDISMIAPPAGTSISDGSSAFPFYIYPITGLRKVDEKLSILKASKQNPEKAADSKGMLKVIAVFAALLLVMAIVFAVLTAIKSSKKAELQRLNDYIYDPEVVMQVAEYDAMYGNMEEIGSIQGGVDILHEDIDSYPVPDSTVNEKIMEAAGAHNVAIDFNSYSASTGIFSVTASSPVVDDINMFIADLMAMDIFESVDYTGYALTPANYNDDDEDDVDRWQINVVCTLADRDNGAAAGAVSADTEEVN